MITKVAQAKGVNVTFEDFSNPNIKSQKVEDSNSPIDYLVCSSDLHPTDAHVLIERLHKGIVFRNFMLIDQIPFCCLNEYDTSLLEEFQIET